MRRSPGMCQCRFTTGCDDPLRSIRRAVAESSNLRVERSQCRSVKHTTQRPTRKSRSVETKMFCIQVRDGGIAEDGDMANRCKGARREKREYSVLGYNNRTTVDHKVGEWWFFTRLMWTRTSRHNTTEITRCRRNDRY